MRDDHLIHRGGKRVADLAADGTGKFKCRRCDLTSCEDQQTDLQAVDPAGRLRCEDESLARLSKDIPALNRGPTQVRQRPQLACAVSPPGIVERAVARDEQSDAVTTNEGCSRLDQRMH